MRPIFLTAAILSVSVTGLSTRGNAQHHDHGEARPAAHAADSGPVAELSAEHELIAAVVHAAATEAKTIQKTGQVNSDRVRKMVIFFQNFADGCHHLKEERYLFPRLRETGADPATIDLMLGQHQHGRRLLKETAELLVQPNGMTPEHTASIAQRLDAYAKLMHEHIETENTKLWPAASKHLGAEAARRLQHAFEVLETVELGEDFHHKYHALAEQILAHEAPARKDDAPAHH
jgi:hemerythrin-like domain-containing protein